MWFWVRAGLSMLETWVYGLGLAVLSWALGAGWAWCMVPKMVPSLVCKEAYCMMLGCLRACGPLVWF